MLKYPHLFFSFIKSSYFLKFDAQIAANGDSGSLYFNLHDHSDQAGFANEAAVHTILGICALKWPVCSLKNLRRH
jgi:hypothetical protein